MIDSFKQAKAVQGRRVLNHHRGYAKAVRRWMARDDSFHIKGRLPVYWGPAGGEVEEDVAE